MRRFLIIFADFRPVFIVLQIDSVDWVRVAFIGEPPENVKLVFALIQNMGVYIGEAIFFDFLPRRISEIKLINFIGVDETRLHSAHYEYGLLVIDHLMVLEWAWSEVARDWDIEPGRVVDIETYEIRENANIWFVSAVDIKIWVHSATRVSCPSLGVLAYYFDFLPHHLRSYIRLIIKL